MANVIRIKRRAAGGAAGAPASLATTELAYNEQDQTLYIGRGDNGSGVATSVEVVAGLGAFLTPTSTATLTNKSISGASNTFSNIPNGALTNSAVTINGSAVSLGGSVTITAVSPNALTIGTGLTGTSYNGSSAVTIAVDTTTIATRAYVDGVVQGIAWKPAARVLAAANVNLAAPGTTIDGVTMATGDVFAAFSQTTGSQNGLYVWNGSAVAATRIPELDVGTEFVGAAFLVREGTAADRQYIVTNDTFTLGTTTAAITQIGGGTGGVTAVTNNGTGAQVGQNVTGSTLNLRRLNSTAGSGSALGITTTENTNDISMALSGTAGYAQGGTGADLSGLTTGALLKKGASALVAAVAGTDYHDTNSTIVGGTF